MATRGLGDAVVELLSRRGGKAFSGEGAPLPGMEALSRTWE
jgi:hypothetical protein